MMGLVRMRKEKRRAYSASNAAVISASGPKTLDLAGRVAVVDGLGVEEVEGHGDDRMPLEHVALEEHRRIEATRVG